jgi:hypothetical protein
VIDQQTIIITIFTYYYLFVFYRSDVAIMASIGAAIQTKEKAPVPILQKELCKLEGLCGT